MSISHQTRQVYLHEKFWPEEFLRLTVKNFYFSRLTTEMSGCGTALQWYLFSYRFNHATRTRKGLGRGSKKKISRLQPHFTINHNYDKIVKFDWLSIVLISALVLAQRIDNFVTRSGRGSREDRKRSAMSLWL